MEFRDVSTFFIGNYNIKTKTSAKIEHWSMYILQIFFILYLSLKRFSLTIFIKMIDVKILIKTRV